MTKKKFRPSQSSSLNKKFRPPEGWAHLRWWEHRYPIIRENLIKEAEKQNYKITPHEDLWFRALELTPAEKVKVVILGNDPDKKGRSNGLAYGTDSRHHIPPVSTRTVLHEYCRDLGYAWPREYSLKPWAEAGVLLLNQRLTTRLGRSHYHRCRPKGGWELLTYEILSYLSYERRGLVWMLWGGQARRKKPHLWLPDNHLILECSSPGWRGDYIAHKPFSGCSHFSTACEYLDVDYSFWRLR